MAPPKNICILQELRVKNRHKSRIHDQCQEGIVFPYFDSA